MQGSDTWDKKTTFAKQKWATKKLAKYVYVLQIDTMRAARSPHALMAFAKYIHSQIEGFGSTNNPLEPSSCVGSYDLRRCLCLFWGV